MTRIKTSLLVVLVGVMLAGCEEPMPALFGLFDAGEAVFEPALLGAWVEPDLENPGAQPRAIWTFEKANGRDYKLTISEVDKPEREIWDIRLGRINDALFLDAHLQQRCSQPEECESRDHLVGVHYFGVLQLEGAKLSLCLLDRAWFEAAAKAGRVDLRAEKPEGELLLLASPVELKEFAARYAWDKDAFAFRCELHRPGADAATAAAGCGSKEDAK